MSDRLLLRLGAATGIATAGRGGLGFALLATSAGFIPFDATDQQITRVLSEPAPAQTFIGIFCEFPAALAMAVFVGP